MTDEGNISKTTNENDQQEIIESDAEQDDIAYSDDKSNVTTDDEFYDELMSAPSEFEDHLIPKECKDEIDGIEHLTACLNRRYNSCPAVFTGSLKDALKEAYSPKEVKERRSLLIYVNNDKSIYSNLFCKQLLCHDRIIDYLLNNFVVWAWDVTFPSNGEKLNEMYKAAFPQCMAEQQLGTRSSDQYPLLISIRRDRDGDYVFERLIDGSNKRPVVDEFLGRLIQFKDRFDLYEEEFERAKEETKRQVMNNIFRPHDFSHGSIHNNDRDFHRAASMFSQMNYNRNASQYARLHSSDNNNHFVHNRMPIFDAFQQLRIDPDDGDDEDDIDGPTPTVEHPPPKFPQ